LELSVEALSFAFAMMVEVEEVDDDVVVVGFSLWRHLHFCYCYLSAFVKSWYGQYVDDCASLEVSLSTVC